MQTEEPIKPTLSRTYRVFRILYRINVSLISLALLWMVATGVYHDHNHTGGAVGLALGIGMVYFVTPLLGPFLILNMWGAIRYQQHRIWYALLSILSIVWLYHGIERMQNMVLP